jgi:fructose-specific phosphotransferase system component IIB
MFTKKNEKELMMNITAQLESLYYTVNEKLEDEENKPFICEDTKEELSAKSELAGKVAMGDDDDLTPEQVKDAHAYLDRFTQEIAYKRRFESHFVEFKKDILKHIDEMQKGIDDLSKSKP